jgi:hypothetical protein
MRALPAVLAATAATIAVSGFLPSDDASADHDRRRRDDDSSEVRRLRDELAYYQQAYDEMHDGLVRIERAADKLRDRRAGAKIRRIAEDTLDRASETVNGGSYDDGDYYDNWRYTVSDSDFSVMSQRVAGAAYADEQLALVQELAAANYFTVSQVVALMKSCTYEDTRIEAAVSLYPRIVDPENWYLVNDGFTYSSSKKTLRERLGQ